MSDMSTGNRIVFAPSPPTSLMTIAGLGPRQWSSCFGVNLDPQILIVVSIK